MCVDIGNEIKRARVAAGLSQTQLAELCGWETQGKISHIETQRRKLEFYDMVKIEDALKLKRGTLYARARGDIGPTDEEDLAVYDALTAEQTVEMVKRLLDVADLDVYQRSTVARLFLEIDQADRAQ